MLNIDMFEDIIHQLNECQYISDLRHMVESQQYIDEIIKVVHGLSVEAYSFEQWNELYNYLLKKKCSLKTAQDIKQDILEKLNQKASSFSR